MKPLREASLQWRLTLSLLLATGLVWVVVLALTWQETQHELTELLDAHLGVADAEAAGLACAGTPAQARDALSWSKYINEAIELFGDRTELVGEAPAQWVALGGRADDEASAVQVQDARAACARIRRRGTRVIG